MLPELSFKLATGDWRLATGDWRLATGDWQKNTLRLLGIAFCCLPLCLRGSSLSDAQKKRPHRVNHFLPTLSNSGTGGVDLGWWPY
jgi:hypothetical protein